MKGDFSRFTFDRRKHYTGVRLQQGRVQLDADWNEQVDIAGYLRRSLAQDLIGASGAPKDGGGFEVKAANNQLTISPGRYWVHGILCENDAPGDLPLEQQPDLPGFALPREPGAYVAYLDVWEREITALEDPDLLELALGGPDTATRTRTVWQVRLHRLGNENDVPPECRLIQFPPASWNDRITLAARTRRPPTENQLYRVEVHKPGGLNEATFKWSRDNGSAAALIERPGADPANPNKLVIARQIQGGGFEAGQWVEVTDEARLLQGSPGTLVQLSTVSGQELTVASWPDNSPPALSATPIVRRWDSSTAGGELVARPAANDGFLALEEGLEVRFDGSAGATLRSGDYWTIPVRAAAGALWPQEGGGPAQKPPDGTTHHYAPLAVLVLSGGVWSLRLQCRTTFEPTVTGGGLAKVNRTGDTMTGTLTIDAGLTVQRAVTIGKADEPGAGSLRLIQGPIIPAAGKEERGIQFEGLTTRSGPSSGFLRFLGDPIENSSQVSSPRLQLEANGEAAIVLRTHDKDALTANNGNIGIGVARGLQKLHVEGGALFRPGSPAGGVVIESSLTLKDGSQKAGRFLVSDASGRGTWQDAAQSIGSPIFLPQRLFVAYGTAPTGWTRYVLPSDKVPSGVRAVILEADAAKSFPDSGILDAFIWVRRGPDEPMNILLRGRSAGAGDVIAWSNQGLFPVKSDNSFEYLITESGFDGGWHIHVVGYFP